jgi:Uma2 family endonuclease
MSTPIRFTTRDLEYFPKPLDDTRYEIIDGELYVSTQPHWEHQYTCTQISLELAAWDRETGLGRTVAAPGLVFSEDNNVAPDIAWISRARIPEIVDDSGHFRAAPELVVEVLSPGAENERRDREVKLALFSRQGVREYWIADWRSRSVQVHRRREARLELVATLFDDDTMTSPLLPGFACPIARFWL